MDLKGMQLPKMKATNRLAKDFWQEAVEQIEKGPMEGRICCAHMVNWHDGIYYEYVKQAYAILKRFLAIKKYKGIHYYEIQKGDFVRFFIGFNYMKYVKIDLEKETSIINVL